MIMYALFCFSLTDARTGEGEEYEVYSYCGCTSGSETGCRTHVQRRLSQEGIRRIDAFLEESVRDGICEYDGIFASSDVHAVVILKKLRELGVRVPEQVQLIGYDGLRVLNVGDYAVSSIAQPVRRMAMSCVDVLLKLIEKKPVGDSVILPVKFVDGGTTR